MDMDDLLDENRKLKRELVIVKEKGFELFKEIEKLKQQNQKLFDALDLAMSNLKVYYSEKFGGHDFAFAFRGQLKLLDEVRGREPNEREGKYD